MLIADGHVHFHPCFRLDRFLDAAWENLGRASGRGGVLPGSSPEGGDLRYLLLAESPGVDAFGRWEEAAGAPPGDGRWRLEATGEDCSLLAFREDEARIAVVAGRQVPTAERLEVLGLGTRRNLPVGFPLRETLAAALDRARIVCIPWGFGKWWFRRGRLVSRAVEEVGADGIYLGDNAARPRPGRAPAPFRLARRAGVRILPGSDPFPLRRHETRAGRFCFRVPGEPDPERPMDRLAGVLAAGAEPVARGERSGFVSFVRDQLGLRLSAARADRYA